MRKVDISNLLFLAVVCIVCDECVRVATCCETQHLRFYLPALAKRAGAPAAPQKHQRGRFHLLFMQQYLYLTFKLSWVNRKENNKNPTRHCSCFVFIKKLGLMFGLYWIYYDG